MERENENSFDNLVSGMSKEERMNMLEKMHDSASSYEEESFEPVEVSEEEPEIPLDEQLKKESLGFRILLWLRSVFTNTKPVVLFNEIKISEISKNLQRNYPGLVDAKKGLLLTQLYEKIVELKEAADFLRPYIVAIDKDEGSFYVFLASIIMSDVDDELSENTNPLSTPVITGEKPELRVELIRSMEDILQNIPVDSKQRMYEAVKTVEWLRQFTKIPFIKILSPFSEVSYSVHTCAFSVVGSEFESLAKLLCNGFRLSDNILESLYLFAVRKSRKFSEDAGGEDKAAINFMNNARANASTIHMFMTSVPMRSVSRVILGDSKWMPAKFYGGEDWFAKYKAQWKKIFDYRWNLWVTECKKESLRIGLKDNFGLEKFPVLPNRPWNLDSDFFFRYELTAGFLNWYFTEKFPKTYEIALKTVMIEGSFKKKENQLLYTEAFNNIVHLSIAINTFCDKLRPTGEFGIVFSKDTKDENGMRTLQGQNLLEKTMREIESEMQSILHAFGEADREMMMLLDGILGFIKDSKYDTLTNLSRIQGHENPAFIATLKEAKDSLSNALTLVRELENVDAPQSLVEI